MPIFMFCKWNNKSLVTGNVTAHRGGLTALLITLTKPTKQRCAEKLRHLSLILLESFKKQKIQWKQKWSSKAGNVAACVNLDPWWRGRKSLMFTIRLFPFIWEVLSLRQPQTDIKLNSWEVDLTIWEFERNEEFGQKRIPRDHKEHKSFC